MVIDTLIIVVFIYFLIVGFRRGCWLSIIHLLSSVFSLWVASQFYQLIVDRLIVFLPYPKTKAFDTTFTFQFTQLQHRFETIIAFIFIAVLCKLILYLIINTFDKIVTYHKVHIFSRALGMIVSIVMAVIVIHFCLYVIALYPNDTLQQQLRASILSHQFIYGIPYLSQLTLNL